jgi:hypothetical protein
MDVTTTNLADLAKLEQASQRDVDATPAMDAEEFANLHAIVKRDFQKFEEIGIALTRIKDGRGYRHLGYATFDAYCRKEFGWGRQTGFYYIGAARVAANVNSSLQTPISLTQARVLAPLPADEQRAVVEQVDLTQTTVRELRQIVDDKLQRRDPQPEVLALNVRIEDSPPETIALNVQVEDSPPEIIRVELKEAPVERPDVLDGPIEHAPRETAQANARWRWYMCRDEVREAIGHLGAAVRSLEGIPPEEGARGSLRDTVDRTNRVLALLNQLVDGHVVEGWKKELRRIESWR